MSEKISAKRTGLPPEQAQKVLDYAANRLSGTDNAIAERLLEELAGRLCGLDDIASVKRLIAQGDDVALRHLGGLEGAKGIIVLVERIARE
jgi:hypothetical protein